MSISPLGLCHRSIDFPPAVVGSVRDQRPGKPQVRYKFAMNPSDGRRHAYGPQNAPREPAEASQPFETEQTALQHKPPPAVVLWRRFAVPQSRPECASGEDDGKSVAIICQRGTLWLFRLVRRHRISKLRRRKVASASTIGLEAPGVCSSPTPKDFTPVFTTELDYMARIEPEFNRSDVKIIPLNIDHMDDHVQMRR